MTNKFTKYTEVCFVESIFSPSLVPFIPESLPNAQLGSKFFPGATYQNYLGRLFWKGGGRGKEEEEEKKTCLSTPPETPLYWIFTGVRHVHILKAPPSDLKCTAI